MRNLVAGVDLGQRLAVAVIEVGRVPMKVRRLECYRWEAWQRAVAVRTHETTAAWLDCAAEFLRESLDWLRFGLDDVDVDAVACESTWLLPVRGKRRVNPASLYPLQRQAEELCRMFGERCHVVSPQTVSRETGINKEGERFTLTGLLLPPANAPANTGRIVDGRSHWHPLLESYEGKRGGEGVVADVLSAMKLGYYAATRLVGGEEGA